MKGTAFSIEKAPKSVYETNLRLNRVVGGIHDMFAGYGGVDFLPDYQRGHVWSHEQQVQFIESLISGYLPKSLLSIQFNCPHWNDTDYLSPDLPQVVQCVDGLQRFHAMQGYIEGTVKPFGASYADLEGSEFDARSYTITVAVHAFKSKKDVLSYYLKLNRGGTPHSTEELNRVQTLLNDCL